MSDFDQADFAAKLTLGSLDRAASLFAGSVGNAKQKLSVAIGAGFQKYRTKSRERYGYVKTLLHRDKPIALEELYVPTYFHHDNKTLSDADLLRLVTEPCKILIQGTAGGGKSIFLRYLNLVVSESNSDILPLFFEMKSLDTQNDETLISALIKNISSFLKDITESTFISLLSEGRIILILDGFDEINYEYRESYVKQLSELMRLYPQSRIVASSRPDDAVESIESFDTYKALPFNKSQAIALLERLPYDPTVKTKFIEAVDRELYDKHEDFLSNPLLITMMLMTYQQFAEIPNKVHIFYQQAFFTLFSLHDSSKEVFKRKTYSELPIDEFQRVFSCFCAITYAQQDFTFSETTVRDRLRQAVESELIKVSVHDYLRDLLESTCLLQKDGIHIVFVHRSFQEYFTAMYITRMDAKTSKRAIDSILKRASLDLVLPMSFEMNPALIEKHWVLPTIDAIQRRLSASIDNDNPFRTLSLFFGQMYVNKGKPWMIYDSPKLWANRLRALHKLYSHGMPHLDVGKFTAGSEAFIAKYQSDPSFSTREVGLDAHAKLLLKANGRSDHLVFDFSKMPDDMCEYFDCQPWLSAITDWLPKLRADVSARVSDRDNSMKIMFNA